MGKKRQTKAKGLLSIFQFFQCFSCFFFIIIIDDMKKKDLVYFLISALLSVPSPIFCGVKSTAGDISFINYINMVSHSLRSYK